MTASSAPIRLGGRRFEVGVRALAHRINDVAANTCTPHDHCRQQAKQLGADNLVVPVGINPADELTQACRAPHRSAHRDDDVIRSREGAKRQVGQIQARYP